jgi:hypothetical protein
MAIIDCFPEPPVNPVETGTFTIVKSLDEYFDCVIIDPCCDCNNCVKDIMPYIESDVFYYNFNFKVEKIELIDISTGALLADKTATWKIGDKQIKMDGSDTSGFTCFAIRVNDDCCLCTGYQLDPCPADSMIIEGLYENGQKDCGGNLYDGTYSNRMRIKGYLFYKEHRKEITENEDGEVSQLKNIDIDQLDFYTEFHNRGFSIDHLTKVILNGYPIQITLFDGTVHEYDYFKDSVSKQTGAKDIFWRISLDLTQLEQCEINEEC